MKNLLCLTDFSAPSDNALQYTHDLAQCLNSCMILFHSLTVPVCPGFITTGGESEDPSADFVRQERLVRQKLQHLENQLENLDWGLPIRYSVRVKEGLLSETISEAVAEEKANLVVIGYEGETKLRKILKDSTAAKVIRQAFCPVLIVPRQATFRPLHTIVFATDLRGEPAAGMDMVIKTAQVFEARILFLHIQTDGTAGAHPVAEEQLNRIYKRLPYKNISFHIQQDQQVEEGINKFVRRHKADMVVMGFHPRTAWGHLFGGEQTQEETLFPPLPVLVFPYLQ